MPSAPQECKVILRARIVLPVSQPPIENGAVVVSENKIRVVGSWPDLESQLRADEIVFDLGEVILLPGLVNAHCHLDYTDMAGQWPPPKTFVDWIPLMLAAKAEWSYTDFAKSWINGAKMLLRTGTTTVADIEAVPDLLPEVWDATPLRVFSFLEMTGIRARRKPKEILREAVEKIDSLSHSRCRASLSPHAPYSTSPELLKLSAKIARKKNWRLTMHVSESGQEFEMFMEASGKMFDWLKRNERDNSDCGLGSPVEHLARNEMRGENLLAVHVNLLAHGDASLLGKHRVHVVHCPRSHDYFQHPPFLRERLGNAGVNICLGTDSLSTTRKIGKRKLELNMFDEMRALATNDRNLSPVEILRMATVNGARALGLTRQIGELSENSFADLIAIPFDGKIADIYDAVLHHPSTVAASMIDGQWAIAP
jgi:aminodeoxyfutalosine deaminase